MKQNHLAKKRFGQNFLVDQNVIEKITDAIKVNHEDDYLEIGPGLGALTQHILPKISQLHVVDIDHDIIAILEKQFAESENLTIIQSDILKLDISQHFSKKGKLHVFGNLPYNISSPILFHCLKYTPLINNMIFMLQKEVVDRMVAEPGTKQYGRLSVMLNYHCKMRRLFNVSKNSFQPPPKVISSVVQLVPHEEITHQVDDYKHFEVVVREAFSHRRKTLHNALKNIVSAKAFEQSGIDSSLRAEVLDVNAFVSLANASLALS